MSYPWYNTASPTPTTKNTITNIAIGGIRDFLLNRNLLPVYPQIPTGINGSPRIGEPVLDTSVNGNANVSPIGLPLETEGLLRYNLAVLPNQFKDTDPNAPLLLQVENLPASRGMFGDVEFPNGQESYPRTSNTDISDYGILAKTNYAQFRQEQTLLNLYVDASKQIDMSDYIVMQPLGGGNQYLGYLDSFGYVNNGIFGAPNASDILGTTLASASLSAGLSLAGGGVNFDFEASLSSRSLGSSSPMTDTKLGFLGSQQLAFELANNASFNTPTSYSITVPTGFVAGTGISAGVGLGLNANLGLGGIGINASFGASVGGSMNLLLGYNAPVSYLNDAASIFTSEYSSGNIERANAMLANTGPGQLALLGNVSANMNGSGQYDNPNQTLFRSGYVAGYKNANGKLLVNGSMYAFYNSDGNTVYNFITPNKSDGGIPQISYGRNKMIQSYGFLAPEDEAPSSTHYIGYIDRKISDINFTWNTSTGGLVNSISEAFPLPLTNKKSLLTKTQILFNSKGMKNIVSTAGEMNKTSSQIETTNGGGISRGSAVLTAAHYNKQGQYVKNISGASETFCRSWTTLNRYDQVSKLIRSGGLTGTSQTLPFRFHTQNSTLEDGGFVKIAPYTTDKMDPNSGPVDPKNYMFSIENLAWNDAKQNLPPVEYGMGDLTTGKRGRIMWFPPYNIQFSESSNVNWETTNFIGRGEPIYTYNNTERSGNLSWSIVVDHPSYINAFRGANGPDDNYVASFFAGCVDPTSYFAQKLTVTQISTISQSQPVNPQQANITSEPEPDNLDVYFPNDRYDLSYLQATPGYEDGGTAGIGTYQGQLTPSTGTGSGGGVGTYIDRYNFGLNSDMTIDGSKQYTDIWANGSTYFSDLATYMTNKCPHCVVNIAGYASPQGDPTVNTQLAQNRANTLKDYIVANVLGGSSARIGTVSTPPLTSVGCVAQAGADTDTNACKEDRKVTVSFQFNPNLAQQTVAPAQPQSQNNSSTANVSSQVINRLYNEGVYFTQLTSQDKFVFDRFRDKIKYFHPAFHSTTPEGLNSRLTFLQQCTRQGPTQESTSANNLAFGRPPVCILRVGDFYNTKIIIDNISIEYEPLVWDLNPEGIGVQPMIANVNMSFKFIGGSSLMGPINKLQNALSFNYYANAHVYDPRADYIAKNPNTVVTPIGGNGSSTSSANGVNLPAVGISVNRDYGIFNDTVNGSLSAFTTTNAGQSNTTAAATTNQQAAANAPNGVSTSTPPAAGSSTTDASKINFATIVVYGGGEIGANFSINGALSADQNVSFVLTVGSDVYNLSTATIGSADTMTNISIFLKTSASGDLTPKLTSGTQYMVTAKFTGFNKTNSFTYKP